jgi:MFS family permease
MRTQETFAVDGDEPSQPQTPSELRRHLPVVIATHVCLSLAVGTVVAYTHGIFAAAVREEFGWSQARYAVPLMAFFFGSAVGSLLCGFLVDRIGARRLIIGSTALLALGLGSISLLPPSLPAFSITLGLLAILGCGTLPIAYSRVIVAWFDGQRGLALGIALTGVGTGATILPLFVQAMIEAWDWRSAYLGLAALVALVSLPTAVLFIRMPPRSVPQTGINDMAAASSSKLLRRPLLVLGAVSIGCGVMLTSLLVHLVPILATNGVDARAAAKLAAVAGVSVILGRLTIGYLLDRFFGPRVLAACLVGPTLAALVLAASLELPAYAVAAALVGFAQGAEVDAVAYLVSRYFAPAHFGRIFGSMFALFTLGAASGPVLVAVAAGSAGGFTLPLFVLSSIGVLTSSLCLLLPTYATARPPVSCTDGSRAEPKEAEAYMAS